ncbi:MAG: hypothetical protein ACRDVD_07530 [Acidimicrobiia bacterium]
MEGRIHNTKGLGVLAGAAAMLVLGVLGLARITVPDVPTFAEELAQAEQEGAPAVLPTAVGAQLLVTGDREGTFSLDRQAPGGLGFGLQGDDGTIYFEGDPSTGASIKQMSYDGLDFFLDPDDCIIALGEVNTDTGVAAVAIECLDIRDVRDTATITLSGPAGMPADLVVVRTDLPPTGGSFTLDSEPFLTVEGGVLDLIPQPALAGDEGWALILSDEAISRGLFFAYGHETHELELGQVAVDNQSERIDAGACEVTTTEVGVINPQTSLVEVGVDCPNIDIEGLGTVALRGSAVVEQIDFPTH